MRLVLAIWMLISSNQAYSDELTMEKLTKIYLLQTQKIAELENRFHSIVNADNQWIGKKTQNIVGPRGPQGIKGQKGETGDKGKQGEKGDRGQTGHQGDRGSRGNKGAKGRPGKPATCIR